MVLIIKNQTAGSLSYLGGLVAVSGNSNYTVGLQYIYPVSRDAGLVADCLAANVILNDSMADYSSRDAIDYLNRVALSLGGAVVGYNGSPAPNFQITIGGKDSNGNSKPARMNEFADIATNFRNTFLNISGNHTTTVKSGSGTLHGIMINNGTGGVAKIYDNTSGSGTVIATIQLGSPSGGLLSTSGMPNPVFLGPLGLEFTTGLTIVTTGSASNDITAIYQ